MTCYKVYRIEHNFMNIKKSARGHFYWDTVYAGYQRLRFISGVKRWSGGLHLQTFIRLPLFAECEEFLHFYSQFFTNF